MSNWQPVLLNLVQSGRKIDAVKLWAKVRGVGLEPALHEMEEVYSLRRPFPTGDEYPDVRDEVLSFYVSQPWLERGRTMNITDLAQAIATETGEHYRMYLMNLRRLYQDRRIATSGEWKAPILSIDSHEVPEDCIDLLAWMRRVGIELDALLACAG
jgi:hypothetical protein